MKTYDEQMAKPNLNENQREAAEIGFNAVVAAGAGSGKTKVLASRFLHLVVQKKIRIERILALTFTKKATAEMRGRIYSILAETEGKDAKDAASRFYSAQIYTLDSFCANICRTACRAYGISPDFAIDDEGIKERANQAALSFILQKRESPAIISLMKKFSIEEIADGLFVAAMKEHSSLSSPLNFEKIAAAQKKAVREEFAVTLSSIISLVESLNNPLPESSNGKKPIKTQKKNRALLEDALKADFTPPDIADRKAIARFVKACDGVSSISDNLGHEDASETLNKFKKQAKTMARIASFILNEEIIDETFVLLAEFQEIFNGIKRRSNALTFRDLSQMAVDALKGDEALWQFWKGQFYSIMIDEFQDNNELQKDLLYLLSAERYTGGIPKPDDLEKDKLFFVGDEKQSIFRFRGADVSVFRRLKTELGQKEKMPQLSINYRTQERLLAVFNSIFPYVLCPADAEKGFDDFEAEFSSLKADGETKTRDVGVEVILFAEERFDKKKKDQASKIDSEAQVVAQKIKELKEGKFEIWDKDAKRIRPCEYSDIAILFKSTTKQRRFEQALRDEGIPFASESLTGLFSDAPTNDFYALLRLACNPEDTLSYSVVLRSPFAAVDDASWANIMTARAEAAKAGCAFNLPFSDADAALVAEASKEKFAKAADVYAFVQEKADKISIAQLVSALWYDFGYRYAVISDPSLIPYCEIYDYFFELARQADASALSLSDFLDGIDEKRKEGERFDEIDVPAGKGGGVRLMTVHASKGLEFPIVFIVDAGNKGRTDSNSEPFYYSDKYEVTINTETPDELKVVKDIEKGGGNFFYMKAKAENAAKAAAETKRLLYVAMTRAESKLFVSGCVNLKLKDVETPKESRSEEELREIIAKKIDKKDKDAAQKKKKGEEDTRRFSFLDLLLRAIVEAGEIDGLSIREVLPKTVEQRTQAEQDAGISLIKGLIEGVECVKHEKPERARFAASELSKAKKALAGETQAADDASLAKADRVAESAPKDKIDALLKKHNITHADFGTYVHSAIEERFTGSPASIPQEVREAASEMADRFFDSDIGKAAKSASWRKTEYGFAIKTNVEGLGEDVVVKGKMDLVFEDGGTLFVVDYKTDKEENPDIYRDQMQTYKKAAKGLFAGQFPDAKVEGRLFYLRQGIVVEV